MKIYLCVCMPGHHVVGKMQLGGRFFFVGTKQAIKLIVRWRLHNWFVNLDSDDSSAWFNVLSRLFG